MVVVSTALYPAAGAVLVLWGEVGFYRLVPAFLSSIVIAILDSWVLLIEINR